MASGGPSLATKKAASVLIRGDFPELELSGLDGKFRCLLMQWEDGKKKKKERRDIKEY